MIIKDIGDINRYKCIIIYGNDAGKVVDSKNKILNKIMPNHTADMGLINITNTLIKVKDTTDDDYNQNSNILTDEFRSMSFFSNRKVITLDIPPEPNRNMSKIISSYVESLKILFDREINSDNVILITTANNLDKTSALRKFAESNKYCACLAVYQDMDRDIKSIVKERLENFHCDNDVINYLCSCLIGDRMVIYSEIDKLMMYKGNDKNITINDAKNVIFDNSVVDEGDFVNSVADLDIDKTYIELCKLHNEGVYSVVLIRYLINYFLQLHLIKYKLQNGETLDELLRGVFWKQVLIIKKHIPKFSLENINYMLVLLLEEECRAKGIY
ncbi:MAG: DNA polymerase III subunit delta [Rickettsiales bacterium]|jgi:DNA polymerase-3 subunit delta|nr:DNA polymerase III subunit delta [Rickettsiales bacterium]